MVAAAENPKNQEEGVKLWYHSKAERYQAHCEEYVEVGLVNDCDEGEVSVHVEDVQLRQEQFEERFAINYRHVD